MDQRIEQDFVKQYIDKEYQERLIFELGSAKRRSKALSRFSHDAEALLNSKVYKRILGDLSELWETDATVYIVSDDERDGTVAPLKEAIRYCRDTYCSTVLIGTEFALIKEETERGAPKIILIKPQ